MNKENYLFDRIRWFATILLLFPVILLFILFFQDWKTEGMEWFIIFLGAVYLLFVYAVYQLIYRPLKINSRIKAAFARGDSYEDIYHMPYLLNEEEQNMLRRFYSLLDKSELITVSKKKSEYLALQNQINPHFLYNTLEGIRAEALIAGVDSIAEMTEALATYFRYTISQVNNLVTLEEELANVENYYYIQQFRFGSKLDLRVRYNCEDEEEALMCQLPKLTLQPIVENSIYHGLEQKIEKGHLDIKITMTDKHLIIKISDDGVGMEKGQVKAMNEKLRALRLEEEDNEETGKRVGIAMKNINNRIKLLFGEEYGIYIYSQPDVGTDVEITLTIVRN